MFFSVIVWELADADEAPASAGPANPNAASATAAAARQSGWESRDNQDENAPLPG